ncbi:hypothetical protein [Mesorhizobium sp. ORM16]|uniref:hypothetical protein n=1 Tax=Mesorhizobium sp. ORM16 TaxID=3376989 RepID=UPI003857E0F0
MDDLALSLCRDAILPAPGGQCTNGSASEAPSSAGSETDAAMSVDHVDAALQQLGANFSGTIRKKFCAWPKNSNRQSLQLL